MSLSVVLAYFLLKHEPGFAISFVGASGIGRRAFDWTKIWTRPYVQDELSMFFKHYPTRERL